LEKVIFKKEVLDYFDELVYTPFVEECFSYAENAQHYVDKIVDFIILEIANFPNQPTSKGLHHLGPNYFFYKANNRTTWYVFFEKQNKDFLITGILNNHCEEINNL
jgi:hypothetical protein